MENSTQKYIIGALVAVLGAAVIFFALQTSPEQKAKDAAATTFGACLKNAGVTFYGASWCPHCQRMKKLLTAPAYTPIYTECATPDGQGQTQVCKDAKIEGYPTWVFKDGSRISGEQTLTTLAQKAGCTVPSEYGDDAKAEAKEIPAATSSTSSAK